MPSECPIFNKSESDRARWCSPEWPSDVPVTVLSLRSRFLNCSRNRIVMSGSELLNATIGRARLGICAAVSSTFWVRFWHWDDLGHCDSWNRITSSGSEWISIIALDLLFFSYPFSHWIEKGLEHQTRDRTCRTSLKNLRK